MKLKSNPFLAASFAMVSSIVMVSSASAASLTQVQKAANSTVLPAPASYVGGAVPTAANYLSYDNTVITGTNNNTAGFTNNTDTLTLSAIGVDSNTPAAGGIMTLGTTVGNGTITLTSGALGDVTPSRPNLTTGYTNAGIVMNAGTGASLVINSNVIIGSAAGVNQQWVTSRNLTINGTTDLGVNSLTFNTAGGTTTFNGIISGTGATALVKGGGQILNLTAANTYTGTTTINAGTLSLTGSGSIANTSAVNVNNGTLSTYSVNAVGASASTINLGSAATQGILTYTGAGETSDRVLNFAGTTGGATINASGTGLLQFTAATTTTGSGGKGVFFGGTGTGRLDGGIVNNGGVLNITKNGAGTWTLNGNIATGASAITVNAGTLNLSGANSYTNGTSVNGGYLSFGNAAAIPTTGTINVNGSGSLVASGVYATVTGWLGDSHLSTTSSGNIALVGNSSENISFTGFNSLGLASTGTATYSGTITAGTSGYIFGGDTSDLTVSSNLTGGNALRKDDAGTVILSGNNNHTGATTVSAGTLNISGTTNGTSGVTVNGGASLVVATGGTLTTSGIFSTAIGTGASITVQTGAALNAASANIAWNPGTFKVDGTLALTGNLAVGTNATTTISGAGSITAGSFSMSNVVTTVNFTNTGSMAITGDMTLAASTSTFNQSAGTISANGILLNSGTSSTYALTGGRINLGANGIGGTGGTKAINLGAGTVGARADWSSTLGISLTDAATGTTFNTLDSVDSTTAHTISLSGVLSGSGQLVKAGDGTLTLSGTNAYTGATNINGGKLVVNGNISTSSMTTVNNTATLGGSGTVGALIAMSGGTVAPGNSPGILSAGNTDLQVGSTLALELGGTSAGVDYDRLNVTGTTTLGGLLSLTVTGTYANNDLLFLLVNDGGDAISGAFSNYAEGANFTLGGQDWAITYLANNTGLNTGSFIGGNDVALMAVPEPSAALLGGLGVLCLLRRRRA